MYLLAAELDALKLVNWIKKSFVLLLSLINKAL